MKIIRSHYLGMCFGVRDAVALALAQSRARPLTILGDLVHNATVLEVLRTHGVAVEHRLDQVRTPVVMITAHGASRRALDRIRLRGLEVMDATCPLVRNAHEAVARLVRQGFHPVIIGKFDHVEVRGITEDLGDFDVVQDEAEAQRLRERKRFGVVAQTTQPIDKVLRLVALIRARFPRSDVRFIDTVCLPTKQRQAAAIELARKCDAVVVVGGPRSNNTLELAATCGRHCARVHRVQDESELRREWFRESDTVGIAAGTSTPGEVIDAVEERLKALDGRP